ncbi:MAG: 30S ribosomal protein S20 [Spirochaetales bacterium]
MAAKGSAEKSQRKSEVRRLRNRMAKSRIRSEIRKFLESIQQKNKEKALELYRVCQKLLDTAARKNIIHSRAAARKKSRLMKKLKSLEA